MGGTTGRTWLLRGLVSGVAVLGALSYIDLPGPLPPVQAGLPLAGLVVLAVSGLLAWQRNWWPAGATLLAAGLMIGPVAAPPDRPDPATATGEGIRVMALNVEFGRADPQVVVRLAQDQRIDVMILTEMTPAGWQRLEEAGLRSRFPHATGRTDTGASGTVILAREPFSCVDTVEGSPCGRVVPRDPDAPSYRLGQTAATFDLPSVRLADGTIIRGVHARPPSVRGNQRWQREQHDLRAWVDARPDDTRLVLAGDFNASPSHPSFRALAAGLARAPHTGFPWTRTWPEGARIPSLIQIDHILSRGFAVTDEGVQPVPGSDHAAVWAQLRPVDGS